MYLYLSYFLDKKTDDYFDKKLDKNLDKKDEDNY